MIIFEQIPLKSFDTLEEEVLMLFIKCGMKKIASRSKMSVLDGKTIKYCNLCFDDTETSSYMSSTQGDGFLDRLRNLLKKYDKSFKHPFSIEVVKDKYLCRKKLKIEEG